MPSCSLMWCTIAGTLARQGQAGEGLGNAQSIAETELDVYTGLLAQIIDGRDQGDDEAEEIRAGDILQVAARSDAGGQNILHSLQIHIEHFAARLIQLAEDVVIRAGHEHARLRDLQAFDQRDIGLDRADPGRDLGVLVA